MIIDESFEFKGFEFQVLMNSSSSAKLEFQVLMNSGSSAKLLELETQNFKLETFTSTINNSLHSLGALIFGSLCSIPSSCMTFSIPGISIGTKSEIIRAPVSVITIMSSSRT